MYDLNHLFNIGGSTTNAMLKQKLCDYCKEFLNCNRDENSPFGTVNNLDMGGLKRPNQVVEQLIYNCEILFRKYKNYILSKGNSELFKKIVNDVTANVPTCCNLK